jgi:hypothetical protein
LFTEDGDEVVKHIQDKKKFRQAQNGDNLLCPFQCDLSHFRDIKQRDPRVNKMMDNNLVRGIHRANLDAFWARMPGMANANLGTMHRILKVHENVHGIKRGSMFPPQGPHLVEDTFGMKTVVALLDHSLNVGVNELTMQFNTIQETRSAVSKNERTTAQENRMAALAGYKRGGWVSLTLPCTHCGLIDL